MSRLAAIASRYDVSTVDADGYDLSQSDLLKATLATINETIELAGDIVARLSPNCPNVFAGDLETAEKRLRFARADLAALEALFATERAA